MKALLSTGLNRPRKGTDAGDHPPITPMRSASEGELGELHNVMYHNTFGILTRSQFTISFRNRFFLLCSSTGSDGWRLYEYITRHFIATVSQDCKYLQTTIEFNVGTEAFSCSGKTLISPGKWDQDAVGIFGIL